MPVMQINAMQATEIKTEHPKPPMQIIRTPNINQTFITQSLPLNNANMGMSMDQSTPTTAIDDSLTNATALSASTGYNQKDSERKRQDECMHQRLYRYLCLLHTFRPEKAEIMLIICLFAYYLQCSDQRQPFRQYCMQTSIIPSCNPNIRHGMID